MSRRACKIVLLCIWLINLCFTALAQKSNKCNADIIIPIITYTPIHFQETVMASFEYNKMKPCILKRKEGKGISFYWYTNYSNKNKHFNSYKFRHFENDSIWLNITNSNDSTFIFFPTISYNSELGECIPQNAPYYGYIKDNSLIFYNTRKHTIYTSFEKLILNDYGSYRKFIEIYLTETEHVMYNSYIENIYFSDIDRNRAINILKKDFAFYKLYATPDQYDKSIEMFVNFLKKNMVLNKYQENRISEIISQENFNFNNLSYLDKIFTISEMKTLNNIIEDNNLLIDKCYHILLKDVSNIDSNGHFYTDKERQKIVYDLVFNQ